MGGYGATSAGSGDSQGGKDRRKERGLPVRRLLEESAMTRRLSPSWQLWVQGAPLPPTQDRNTSTGVAHEVAVLFAVVTDRDDGKPTRAGFIGRFDDQRHIGRVLNLEVKGGPESSGQFENVPLLRR